MHADKRSELVAMFQLLQEAKEAIARFERGEISLTEAIRFLRVATGGGAED